MSYNWELRSQAVMSIPTEKGWDQYSYHILHSHKYTELILASTDKPSKWFLARGIPLEGDFVFRGKWDHRLAESNCRNIALLPDLAK